MTDTPPVTTQPDNTQWVIIQHSTLPFIQDKTIGFYRTLPEAQAAFNALLENPQWFCRYVLEHIAIPPTV